MPDFSNTDFSKTKIYTIKCKFNPSYIYVGSTVMTLNKRLKSHRSHCKIKDNLLYKIVNNNWDDWYIELYEEYPCNNQKELHRREGEIIKQIGTLNEVIAGRTDKERRIDNHEYIINREREYKKKNKERIDAYNKKWLQQNSDKKAINNKKYRESHKEEIKDRKSKQFTCDCGSTLRFEDKARHFRSKKHINYIQSTAP